MNSIFVSVHKNERIKGCLIISFVTCFIKLVGYFEKIVVAYFLGTDILADIYNTIFLLITTLFIIFREIIEPGFLNIFQKARLNKNVDGELSVFVTFFICLFLISLCVSLCFYFFSSPIIKILLPGFDQKNLNLASDLMQISSLSLVFLITSNLTFITLTIYDKFATASIGDLIFKLVLLISLILFTDHLGIYSFVCGIILGSFVKLFVHLLYLKRLYVKQNQECLFNMKYLKDFVMMSWPLFLGMLFSQISSYIDTMFASLLDSGSISALAYSKKIVDLPIVVIPYAIGIVYFPYFSKMYLSQFSINMKRKLYNILSVIFVLFIPISFIFFFFSDSIVKLLFQRGAFDSYSTILTAKPLSIYSLGIPAFAIETILVLYYFSKSDIKTPIFIGVCCVLINIVMTFVLMAYIGYLAIALSYVISKTTKVIILLILLKKSKPPINSPLPVLFP